MNDSELMIWWNLIGFVDERFDNIMNVEKERIADCTIIIITKCNISTFVK